MGYRSRHIVAGAETSAIEIENFEAIVIVQSA